MGFGAIRIEASKLNISSVLIYKKKKEKKKKTAMCIQESNQLSDAIYWLKFLVQASRILSLFIRCGFIFILRYFYIQRGRDLS